MMLCQVRQNLTVNEQYALLCDPACLETVRNGCSPCLFILRSLSAFALQDLFPFKAYFADAPGTLFAGADYEADLEKARGCWRHLRTMFQELEECRAFELLKVA